MQIVNYGDRVRVVRPDSESPKLLVQQAEGEGWETVQTFDATSDDFAATNADECARQVQKMWEAFPAGRVAELGAALRSVQELPEVRAAATALRLALEDCALTENEHRGDLWVRD